MSQIIYIDSTPASIGDVCQVVTGTPVTFSVISGITSEGLVVAYEWYLTRGASTELVGISSGYTLSNPQEGDQVYLNVVNCSVNGTRIGDWIEDINFYYNDITAGVPQLYYIDLKASFDYEVLSTVLRSDATLLDAEIQINGTPIVWPGSATSVDITPVITETTADSSNAVVEDSIVTLVTTNHTSGTPTLVEGKLKIRRLPVGSVSTTTTTGAPTSTTTTTSGPTSTTTTTSSPTSTTTTTI